MKYFCLPNLILLTAVLLPLSVSGDDSLPEPIVVTNTSTVRFTFEQLTLPQNESLGLFGGSYLSQIDSYGYVGVGIYSAITGERGGFFTGGLEAGLELPISSTIILDGGVFIGGGGGGGAPQGGGLMLRPHAGVLYNFNSYRLGANISRVYFPNGDIDSSQWALSWHRQFKSHLVKGWLRTDPLAADTYTVSAIGKTKKLLAIFSTTYFPKKDTKSVGGLVQDEHMDVTGFRFGQFFSDNRYFLFEVAGAYGGDVDGYAQILLGTGYQLSIASKNLVSMEIAVGGAGGGEVDTGGGGVVQASLALEHRFSRQFGLELKGSYLHAPGGELSAPGVSLYGLYHFVSPKIGDAPPNANSLLTTSTRQWSIYASTQRYFPFDNNWHKSGTVPANTIDLFGLALETTLTKHWYISGETLGAYRGDVGGYAVGLIGLGLRSNALFSMPLYARTQLQVGAAGGGGIDVGGGLITQITAGLEYQFDNRFGFLAQGGRTLTPNGNFEATVASIALSYRFTSLEL